MHVSSRSFSVHLADCTYVAVTSSLFGTGGICTDPWGPRSAEAAGALLVVAIVTDYGFMRLGFLRGAVKRFLRIVKDTDRRWIETVDFVLSYYLQRRDHCRWDI